MGSQKEEEEEEEVHIHSSREEMENLILNDDSIHSSTSKSFSNYRSAISTLSESNHHPLSPPIIATPADSDPLLQPPSPETDLRNPNPVTNSHTDRQFYVGVNLSAFDGDNGIESPGEKTEKVELVKSPPVSSNYLKITVSNPQKEVETSKSNSIVPGGNTYVTYLITTTTNLPEYGGSEFIVRRRFRDVVTLSDRLSEAYRGFFIPPRPDKSVVESQVMHKQEFVEQRRSALEKYLRRLADHPVIRQSDELRVFLKAQGKLPLPTSTDVASRMLDGAVKLPKQLFGDSANVIGPQDVVQPAKGGRDLMRIFKELKQSVANDWGSSRQLVNEEDKEFLVKRERLRDLEQQLSNAAHQVYINTLNYCIVYVL